MKHIKTESAAETAMRKEYSTIKTEKYQVAGPDQLTDLKKLIELTQQNDLIKLEISKLKGRLMGYIGSHSGLEDSEGHKLIDWLKGPDRSTLDTDALIRDFNVPSEWLANHMLVKQGSRVFTVLDE